MARRIEDHLAALHRAGPDELEVVRAALAHRRGAFGVTIAAAARRVADHGQHALAPELVAAFAPLCGEGAARRDPGCRGKVAIARALHELDVWDGGVFAAGLRVTQPEGAPPEDTAAELRGVCGIAHAHFVRPDALDVLSVLLADPWRIARLGAAQGLGDCGQPGAAAVLRYKLAAGSDEPDVVAACFDALLHLAPAESIAFAQDMLARDDERGEAAALALGGARAHDAIGELVRWCADAPPERRRRVGYVALALLRSDPGNAELVAAIRERGRADALAAARALATFAHDPATSAMLRAAIAEVTDRALRAELEAVLA
ncbi:MAG TPA: hypothetical protein VLX92_21740 [Kofleriaceae bacterium]|nr:hypothetical protein [Kofleriaceae bacterium]